MRHQPGGDRDPMPPGRESRRGPRGISMGDKTEESPDRGGTSNESEQLDASAPRRLPQRLFAQNSTRNVAANDRNGGCVSRSAMTKPARPAALTSGSSPQQAAP